MKCERCHDENTMFQREGDAICKRCCDVMERNGWVRGICEVCRIERDMYLDTQRKYQCVRCKVQPLLFRDTTSTGSMLCDGCGLNKWYPKSVESDPVNHPPHYTKHPSGVECIQITEHMNFNIGNAVKYLWRADLKNDALEDLRKAEFYVKREIALREKL